MILLIGMTVLALVLGATVPLRWGVLGFAACALVVFAVSTGIGIASGFEGTSIEESLLLFGGSFSGYAGFKMLIAYRAFALPALALGAVMVFRLTRSGAGNAS
ncbi:hypothetical protein [Planktotalea sp.]|uniref:hypothetical protein n=1 Tax=Planktotalea sp. TaxID=2029877 RepID=UPI003299027D